MRSSRLCCVHIINLLPIFPKVIFKHCFHLYTMYFPVVGICIQFLQWEQFQILFEFKQLGENLKRI